MNFVAASGRPSRDPISGAFAPAGQPQAELVAATSAAYDRPKVGSSKAPIAGTAVPSGPIRGMGDAMRRVLVAVSKAKI